MKKLFILIFIILTIFSCSKNDTFITFCPSGDHDAYMTYKDRYKTNSFVKFGQYNQAGGGTMQGSISGWDVYPFKGLPDGEIRACWVNYKRDIEYERTHEYSRFVPGSDTYYYAFDPDPQIKMPKKPKNHTEYYIQISCGRLMLESKAMGKTDLTDLSYTGYPDGSKYYSAGKKDILYYLALSDGDYGSIESDGFDMTPLEKYNKVPGIAITKKQFEYVQTNDLMLDEKAPGLTKRQLAYIRARPRLETNMYK
ncbi:MAG: hypothetical protein GY710_26505 [Desulfobacteraceae bacterium]|nr:hypothetical protein [Desulfobacteraceae bacterium]